MPRIAEDRAPAEPSSAVQLQRHARILRAASVLATEHDFERVQMHDVAKSAGVAIATLYRYFPSKIHLFAALMHWHVSRFPVRPPAPAGSDPSTAVGDVLIRMTEEMARRRRVSSAMIQANNQAQAAGITTSMTNDPTFERILFDAAGVHSPTENDSRRMRLTIHCWYGVLVSVLNDRRSLSEAIADIRLACTLILTRCDLTAAERLSPSDSS